MAANGSTYTHMHSLTQPLAHTHTPNLHLKSGHHFFVFVCKFACTQHFHTHTEPNRHTEHIHKHALTHLLTHTHTHIHTHTPNLHLKSCHHFFVFVCKFACTQHFHTHRAKQTYPPTPTTHPQALLLKEKKKKKAPKTKTNKRIIQRKKYSNFQNVTFSTDCIKTKNYSNKTFLTKINQ